MSNLDIIILIPILWFAYKGFKKGLVFELASIVALVLGTWASINFSNKVSEWLNLTGNYYQIFAFVITFLAVIIAVYIIAKVVEKLVEITISETINKVFGSLFAILKITFIISVVYMLINTYDTHQLFFKEDIKKESFTYPIIAPLAPAIMPAFKSKIDSLGLKLFSEKDIN